MRTGFGRPLHWIARRSPGLSRLWFDALGGICAHVRGGGGGLTPSDIAPARLTQQEIDELHRQYRIADVLPLTPLQQGLLFHAGAAQRRGRCLCRAAGFRRGRRRLIPTGYAKRCTWWSPGIQTWRHNSGTGFDEPVQIIPAEPVPPWRCVELGDGGDLDADEQIGRVCAAELAAVCDLAGQPASGWH